jgi:UDP-N-acetyl-2-amino-2-deoxyglucuronate dehydrogenase
MMNNKKLRVGIVGCGTIANIHAQAIGQSGNAELFSIYSRNEINARRVGEKYQTKWTDDWKKFISDDALDAVSVCTPNGNHLDYTKKAAREGKHIVLEKPIEITLERAKESINICEEQGVKLAVIYQNRFIPRIQRLKKQIDEGIIGKIFMGDAYIKWFRTQAYYDSGAWRGTFALDGGGVLINQAIHTVDLLQWLMGGVTSVFGHIGTYTHNRLEGEDNAVANLRFKSGAIGVIQASTSVQPAQSQRIEIHGQKGSAILDGNSAKVWVENELIPDENTEKKASTSAGSTSPLAGFSIEPHTEQYKAISNAILRDEAPPVTGSESLKSLAIVLSVYESAKTGRLVDFDNFINKDPNLNY